MGTRGLLGFIHKGKRRGTYNHFDSYPSGLGQEIVKFLLALKPEDYETMNRLSAEITWVKEDEPASLELQERYSSLGYSDAAVSTQNLSDWYCLLRGIQGAKGLPAIQSNQLKHLIDSTDFLEDGLFCEWAYFLDFEEQHMEIWKSGKLVEKVNFDTLKEDGSYMNQLEAKAELDSD